MPPLAERFGLVIDAGSSGTRLRIFGWDHHLRAPSLHEVRPPNPWDAELLHEWGTVPCRASNPGSFAAR